MERRFFIGCSGYAYYEWQGKFYPEGLASSERLDYYTKKFGTVEINSTFYHYPKAATLQKFYDSTPADFRFTIKTGKKITHIQRLENSKEDVLKFQEHVKAQLKEKLIHFLFQLPPSFAYSEEHLERVLATIPHHPENVVEFRHISWWNDTVFEKLTEAGITFCNVDYPKLPKELFLTSHLFYMRLHGDPQLFRSDYATPFLERLVKELPENCEQYTIYFNNTASNAAWKNARTLEELIKNEK